MINNELDTFSSFYFNDQLEIDKALIRYRFLSIKENFHGRIGLEMGPAEGIMTSFLINEFDELDVVEGSSNLLNKIPDYANITKYCSLFEHFVPTRKYDTIIMDHVLEHIEDPVLVLNRVRTWLKDNGKLIVGVPNAKSIHRLVAVKMGLLETEYSLNNRDRAVGHYRVYDSEKLSKDIVAAGYRVIRKGGVFLKPLSNSQINSRWSADMIEGFYELGKDFPDNAAEIFIVASV